MDVVIHGASDDLIEYRIGKGVEEEFALKMAEASVRVETPTQSLDIDLFMSTEGDWHHQLMTPLPEGWYKIKSSRAIFDEHYDGDDWALVLTIDSDDVEVSLLEGGA